MALPDKLIAKYFLLLTDAPEKEIKKLHPRDAKAELAKKIITIYHNAAAAKKAETEFNKVFKERQTPSEMPEFSVSAKTMNILDLLTKIKLASSRSEARRLIAQGGIKINGVVQNNWNEIVGIKRGTIIQTGKRRFAKIR